MIDDPEALEGDPEMVSFETDKTNRMPGESARRRNGREPRRSALWSSRPTFDAPSPEPLLGAYPKGFVEFACRAIGVQPDQVLHVCSGMLEKGQGMRIDLARRAAPDVLADGRKLPFRDDTFPGALIDPPYSVQYAESLYQTEYPRPSHLIREAGRVVKPGAATGIVHFVVPMIPKTWGIDLESVVGITTGGGYRIRAFSILRKRQAELF